MTRAMRTVAFALVTLLVFLSAGHADEVLEDASRLVLPDVEVVFHPGDARLAQETGRDAADAVGIIRERLGIELDERVRVILARGAEEFSEACGGRMPEWSLAAAIPDEGKVVVDASKVAPATANDLRLTLLHEMVHMALGRLEAGRRDRIPRWFHEGVATWLTGRRWMGISRRSFRIAAAHGDLIPFDRLEETFPWRTGEAELAYLQSEAFVDHLVERASTLGLKWILDRYGEGASFDQAFESVMKADRRTVEGEWVASLEKRFPWLTLILEVTTLFGALALATIIIYLVVRRRATRQRARWKQEEEMWAVVQCDVDDDEEEPDEPLEDFDNEWFS